MKTDDSSPSGFDLEEPVDPKWAWHHRALLELRQTLLRAKAEHEKFATAPSDTRTVDAAEAAQEQTEHEVILAELHAETDRLAEIEAALHRLHEGTYGICEETGKPISAARLRAIPWTRYSLSAAARSEERHRSAARPA